MARDDAPPTLQRVAAVPGLHRIDGEGAVELDPVTILQGLRRAHLAPPYAQHLTLDGNPARALQRIGDGGRCGQAQRLAFGLGRGR